MLSIFKSNRAAKTATLLVVGAVLTLRTAALDAVAGLGTTGNLNLIKVDATNTQQIHHGHIFDVKYETSKRITENVTLLGGVTEINPVEPEHQHAQNHVESVKIKSPMMISHYPKTKSHFGAVVRSVKMSNDKNGKQFIQLNAYGQNGLYVPIKSFRTTISQSTLDNLVGKTIVVLNGEVSQWNTFGSVVVRGEGSLIVVESRQVQELFNLTSFPTKVVSKFSIAPRYPVNPQVSSIQDLSDNILSSQRGACAWIEGVIAMTDPLSHSVFRADRPGECPEEVALGSICEECENVHDFEGRSYPIVLTGDVSVSFSDSSENQIVARMPVKYLMMMINWLGYPVKKVEDLLDDSEGMYPSDRIEEMDGKLMRGFHVKCLVGTNFWNGFVSQFWWVNQVRRIIAGKRSCDSESKPPSKRRRISKS